MIVRGADNKTLSHTLNNPIQDQLTAFTAVLNCVYKQDDTNLTNAHESTGILPDAILRFSLLGVHNA